MNYGQDIPERSVSNGIFINDGTSEETNEKLDVTEANIERLRKSIKEITKNTNSFFKLEDVENIESDHEELSPRVQKFQKIRADTDEMIKIGQSIVEKLDERSAKINLLATNLESLQINMSKLKKLTSQLNSKKKKSYFAKKLKKRRKDWSWEISTLVIGAAALILFLV